MHLAPQTCIVEALFTIRRGRIDWSWPPHLGAGQGDWVCSSYTQAADEYKLMLNKLSTLLMPFRVLRCGEWTFILHHRNSCLPTAPSKWMILPNFCSGQQRWIRFIFAIFSPHLQQSNGKVSTGRARTNSHQAAGSNKSSVDSISSPMTTRCRRVVRWQGGVRCSTLLEGSLRSRWISSAL